jgi:hypothetical protein
MELSLNSVWALLAVAFAYLWLRLGRRTIDERQRSFVALVMLIVILFPVISVSDDLWSIQNPAETDTCQRRGHCAGCSHSIFPMVAGLPETAVTGLTLGIPSLDAPPTAPFFAIWNPALHSIRNRPPPAA